MHIKNSWMVLLIATSVLWYGCVGTTSRIGGSSGKTSGTGTTGTTSQLTSTPTGINFGSVAVGSSKSQNGTLSAGSENVTISSASWSGGGFALSGITFPVTVPAGQTVSFSVSFSPQVGGSANGQVSFFSDASNSPATLSLTGAGTGTVQHSVSLSWNASTTPIAGYNIYRGPKPSGPFTKLNSILNTATVYSDGSVASGQTYYYAATSVDTNNVESGYSNIATAVIP